MALNDYKITNNERDSLHVQSAPDVLSKDAQGNKKVFDNLVEYFIGKYNNLVDAVDGNYIEADDVGAGLDVDPLRWKYAMYKGDMIANFSGSITQTPTGYRTTIASVSGLTNDDFMDCLVKINGEQYQCADSVETATGYMTTFEVNNETITVTYVGSDIIFEHENNPLETTYWNVQMFRTDAEKIPTKSLPPNVTIKGVLANTLPPSSQATASWENEVITLGIPKGDKGDKGDTGTAGVSIVSVTRYYLATNIGAGVTRETSGWTETIQTMTSVNQYLWSYETVTGSNGLVISTSDPVIIGRWGQNGADGISITEVYEYFAISNDNQYPPGEWSETPILPTASNKYLWNYSSIVYSDSSVQDTSAKIIGMYSRDGSDAAYLAFSQPPILKRVHGTQIQSGSVMMKFAAYKNGERIPCVGTSLASAEWTVTTVNATTTSDGTITVAWDSNFDSGTTPQAFSYKFDFDGISYTHWMKVNKVYDGAKGDKGDPGEVTEAELLANTIIQTNENTTPYQFRPTPQCGDIEYLDKVVGGTLAVNQMFNFAIQVPATDTVNGVTFTKGDEILTVSGTATADAYRSTVHQVIAGHKYFNKSCPQGGSATTYVAYMTGQGIPFNATSQDTGNGVIVSPSSSGNSTYVYALVKNGTTVNNLAFRPQVVDITQLCGSAIADYVYNLEQSTAGSGVAWLKQYYPSIFNSYQPYNAGTLESVEASAHVMGNKNLADIEDIPAPITTNTEVSVTMPGNSYTLSFDVSSAVRTNLSNTSILNIIDADGANHYYTGATVKKVSDNTDFNSAGANINGRYYCTYTGTISQIVFFWRSNSYGTFSSGAIKNIQLEYGTTATDYEAYTQTSYPLDSDLVLRGIPKLDNGVPYYDGDIYKSDGSVNRRYGIVDLGTLNWAYYDDGTYVFFYNTYIPSGTKANGEYNLLCAKYPVGSTRWTTAEDKICGGNSTSQLIWVRDTAYTDAAAFKTAMSGVYLIYELATPTTETADSYDRVQVCYKGGTEEFVPVERESGTSIVPVGHVTSYPLTLKDTMPTSNGTYTLSLTVTDGKPTLSWS